MSALRRGLAALRRGLARIRVRLLAFNLLLVFLPAAAFLAQGVYEAQRLTSQEQSLERAARTLALALSERGPLSAQTASSVASVASVASVEMGEPERLRVRVVDRDAVLLADSAPGPGFYPEGEPLRGAEVLAALRGREGAARREPRAGGAPVLYRAHPITDRGGTIGALLVSESTAAVERDLAVVRATLLRVFLASLVVALLLSLLVATTIARPLERLRGQAAAVLDPLGRVRGRFRAPEREDEIGELGRALETLSERLARRDALLEGFAADLSHAFKNPLAAIRSRVERLGGDLPAAERDRHRAGIEADVARLEGLLRGVAEVSQIEAGLPSDEFETVDLGILLERLVEGFRARVSERKAFAFDAAPGAFPIRAVPDRLAEAFENLLDNAVTLAPDGSRIEVGVARARGGYTIAVRDRGAGFPEGHEERAFERFFSYRPEAADAASGPPHSGLGLPIARAILEAHGGSLLARNREGGGASLEAWLPAGVSEEIPDRVPDAAQ